MCIRDRLKEVGKTQTPILLKRGMSGTIDELLMAAEYIMSEGCLLYTSNTLPMALKGAATAEPTKRTGEVIVVTPERTA